MSKAGDGAASVSLGVSRGLARQRRRPATWTPTRGYVLFLVGPAALLAVFFLWPLALVVGRSFLEPSPGLGNFVEAVSNTAYVKVLLYTLQVAASVTVVALLLSYPVAWIVSRTRGRALYLCLALILVPFWTSTVIRTYAWLVLFQRRGVLNDALLALGVIDHPMRLLGTSIGVHIGMVHIMLPFMILPLLSAMTRIDPTLPRAASILGANPLRQFLHVYLPLSMPGISAGCLLVFITSLGFFITPALLGGARNTMIAVLIEQQVSVLLDWPMASALATMLLVATVMLYLVYEQVTRRLGARGPFSV